MRAVAYYREFGHDDLQIPDTTSDYSQLFLEYCARESHNLIASFGYGGEDGTQVDAAEQYAQLLQLVKGPPPKPVLVLIPDARHLGSDLETLVTRLLELSHLNCEVRCISPHYPDPIQSGLVFLNLQNRPAPSPSSRRDTILARATQGQVLGKTPYGYTGDNANHFATEPREAEVVRRIFNWYVGADNAKPVGFRIIAQRLNDSSITTRQGNRWSPVTIGGILKNRFYTGTYSRYGIRIVGSHEPIIERPTFRYAQELMQGRLPERGDATASAFLLSGLPYCTTCRATMFGITRRRSWQREDTQQVSRVYRYYECPSRSARLEKNREQVRHMSWQAAKLENLVRELLANMRRKEPENVLYSYPQQTTSELDAVEREFLSLLRHVGDGYTDLDALGEPLTRLQTLRSKPQSRHEVTVQELLTDISSTDLTVAHRAFATLIQSIRVSPRTAKLKLRKPLTSPSLYKQ